MWWRRKKSPKVLAQQLAERFDGVTEFNRSKLDLFWYTIKFRYRTVDIVIEVHASKARIRLSTPKFRNQREFACSFGEPANPGFTPLTTDIFGKESIPIFAPCSRTSSDEEALLEVFSDPKNRQDIIDLRLVRGERLSIYTISIEARFNECDPDVLAHRLDAIAGLYHRNNKPGKLKLYCNKSLYMIPGAPACSDAIHDEDTIRHTFRGDGAGRLPDCINCHAPVHLIATLDTHDPELNVKGKRQRWLHILTCLNCDSCASPLYWKRSCDGFEVIQQERGHSYGEFSQVVAARELRLSLVEQQQKNDHTRSPRHRIGGEPEWIQADYVPACPSCSIVMTFVAQIDTDDDLEVQFGDDGILYVFICQKCGIMSSFAQGY